MPASPDAQTAGLKVWFDKDDLRPGRPWQPQIEQAIANEATAFVVYVGSRGVMNWVETRSGLALSRAATDKRLPLHPGCSPPRAPDRAPCRPSPSSIRASAIRSATATNWRKLLKAVLNARTGTRRPGSSTSRSSACARCARRRSDRFFGREAEIEDLVEKFRKHRIVAIVADSGTGKSSLAQAGFVPAFRGGALIDPAREDAREKIWHVVTMRPAPIRRRACVRASTEAAEKLGRSLDERASLRKQVSIDDASETAFALQCGLPPAKTSTLLIVDQFEELFTDDAGQGSRRAFAALLLALADGHSDVRVLLTVRADYFNLASGDQGRVRSSPLCSSA